MKKLWTKTLVAGSLAAGLTLLPVAAFASGENPPPEAPSEVLEQQDDHQDTAEFFELLGWILIGITSDMVFGEGAMQDAAGQGNGTDDSGSNGNGGTGGSGGPGSGGSTQNR